MVIRGAQHSKSRCPRWTLQFPTGVVTLAGLAHFAVCMGSCFCCCFFSGSGPRCLLLTIVVDTCWFLVGQGVGHDQCICSHKSLVSGSSATFFSATSLWASVATSHLFHVSVHGLRWVCGQVLYFSGALGLKRILVCVTRDQRPRHVSDCLLPWLLCWPFLLLCLPVRRLLLWLRGASRGAAMRASFCLLCLIP